MRTQRSAIEGVIVRCFSTGFYIRTPARIEQYVKYADVISALVL